jgi:DNA-binding CsgD family transcriptional regulator
MSVPPTIALTARERDCLRALLSHGSSKGAADQLGISPGTVDQHLKSARRKLGVSDSWTAARLATGDPAPLQKLDIEPGTLVRPTPMAPADDKPTTPVRPEAEADRVHPGGTPDVSLRSLLFPPVGRPPNTLPIRTRLMLIALQACIIVVATAGVFTVVAILSRWIITRITHNGD